VSPDATSVTFSVSRGVPESSDVRKVLDLATGVVTDAPPPSVPDRWSRGGADVFWQDGGLFTEDLSTGTVTRISPAGQGALLDVSADGRYFVVEVPIGTYHLIDADDGSDTSVPVAHVDDDATRYAGVMYADAPGADRLVVGPVTP
jgi:hypothetical protein